MASWGAPAGAQELGPLPELGVRDATAEGRAFVELAVAPRRAFVGQQVTLRLRVGLERGFLDTATIQPFRRALDVPVQVLLVELGALDCARLSAPPAYPDGPAHPTFALGETIARASRVIEEQRDGLAYTVLELDRPLVPTCVGELALPAPTARFAYATRFEDDLFHGRKALDRQDAAVHGDAPSLTVDPLPEDGRPFAFGGAVGQFAVFAEVPRHEVEVGEPFQLTLSIEGRGDFRGFELPRLDALKGFRLLGVVDTPEDGRRTAQVELAALSADVLELPAIELVHFDPTPPGAWRAARSAPVPLLVRPGTESVGPEVGARGPVLEPAPRTPGPEPATDAPPRVLVALAVLLSALAGIGLAAWLRALSRARSRA